MKTPSRLALQGSLLTALVSLAVGCGGPGKPVKVEGVLTLDGKPLPAATVTFAPVAEGGRAAHGRTEEDGSFKLTTFRTNDGALPGEYKVVVVLDTTPAIQVSTTDQKMMTNEEKMATFGSMSPKGKKAAAEVVKKAKATNPVPALYGELNKTPLKETVPPLEKIEINLTSKGH